MDLAVILDLDETLFDHETSARRGVARLIRELEGEAAPETALPERVDAWERRAVQLMQHRRAGEFGREEYRRRRIRHLLADLRGEDAPVGVDEVDDPTCERLYDRYVELYEQEWLGFEDAVPVLRELGERQVPVAILTNGPEERQQRKVRRLGLADLVGGVWTSERLGAAKPDPRTYLTVCEAIGAAPERVLHVGDNEEFDQRGASAAGLRGIHLDRSCSLPPSAQRIGALGELLALVGRR